MLSDVATYLSHITRGTGGDGVVGRKGVWKRKSIVLESGEVASGIQLHSSVTNNQILSKSDRSDRTLMQFFKNYHKLNVKDISYIIFPVLARLCLLHQ